MEKLHSWIIMTTCCFRCDNIDQLLRLTGSYTIKVLFNENNQCYIYLLLTTLFISALKWSHSEWREGALTSRQSIKHYYFTAQIHTSSFIWDLRLWSVMKFIINHRSKLIRIFNDCLTSLLFRMVSCYY